MSTAIVAGIALATLGFTGRAIYRSPTLRKIVLDRSAAKQAKEQAKQARWQSIFGSMPSLGQLHSLEPPGARQIHVPKHHPGPFLSPITSHEAALILNLRPGSRFTKEEIRDAYKHQILFSHPDRGGSPFLASKINEAKDHLEREMGHDEPPRS
jgi:hypothetical protein